MDFLRHLQLCRTELNNLHSIPCKKILINYYILKGDQCTEYFHFAVSNLFNLEWNYLHKWRYKHTSEQNTSLCYQQKCHWNSSAPWNNPAVMTDIQPHYSGQNTHTSNIYNTRTVDNSKKFVGSQKAVPR